MTHDNLNALTIPAAMGTSGTQVDNSVISKDENTEVYFKNIQENLVSKIAKADVILGCVAWLTSFTVLRELAKKKGVSIIVQKEDFLRPDAKLSDRKYREWQEELVKLYKELPLELTRYQIGGLLSEMISRRYASKQHELYVEWFNDDTMDAIRCFGSQSKDRAMPRMHNKFLVFCSFENDFLTPNAVWTGSFNISSNANKSFENAVYLKEPQIVEAYMREYQQIASLSEPLSWKSRIPSPEWWNGNGPSYQNFDPLGGCHDYGTANYYDED